MHQNRSGKHAALQVPRRGQAVPASRVRQSCARPHAVLQGSRRRQEVRARRRVRPLRRGHHRLLRRARRWPPLPGARVHQVRHRSHPEMHQTRRRQAVPGGGVPQVRPGQHSLLQGARRGQAVLGGRVLPLRARQHHAVRRAHQVPPAAQRSSSSPTAPAPASAAAASPQPPCAHGSCDGAHDDARFVCSCLRGRRPARVLARAASRLARAPIPAPSLSLHLCPNCCLLPLRRLHFSCLRPAGGRGRNARNGGAAPPPPGAARNGPAPASPSACRRLAQLEDCAAQRQGPRAAVEGLAHVRGGGVQQVLGGGRCGGHDAVHRPRRGQALPGTRMLQVGGGKHGPLHCTRWRQALQTAGMYQGGAREHAFLHHSRWGEEMFGRGLYESGGGLDRVLRQPRRVAVGEPILVGRLRFDICTCCQVCSPFTLVYVYSPCSAHRFTIFINIVSS
mmetsp:Transcript_31764/g.61189  ORF Transcript_31764/g.61189 Transcript_31764/m.61189 type:complete len:449 (+) Transcript_31764:486-1832(+)